MVRLLEGAWIKSEKSFPDYILQRDMFSDSAERRSLQASKEANSGRNPSELYHLYFYRKRIRDRGSRSSIPG